jgi:hypothetical protein
MESVSVSTNSYNSSIDHHLGQTSLVNKSRSADITNHLQDKYMVARNILEPPLEISSSLYMVIHILLVVHLKRKQEETAP